MVRSASALSDYRTLAQDLSRAGSVVKELEIRVVSAADYTAAVSDAATKIQSIVNQVSGIFESAVGVKIKIGETRIYSTPGDPDPFGPTTDAVALIQNFAGPQFTNGFDLAHLWTGRNLDLGVVGVAYVDVLCNATFGIALSQRLSPLAAEVVLAAHEFGHNVAARHDGTTLCACCSDRVHWPRR